MTKFYRLIVNFIKHLTPNYPKISIDQYPMTINEQLSFFLQKRKTEQTFRTLYNADINLIDFSSNDYLGLARSSWINQQIKTTLKTNYKYHKTGATGSRLLSGNTALYEELEFFLAGFFHAESALLFNSGYNANLGLIATVARRNDLIIYDEFSHASILQAIKLSESESIKYTHNNIEKLRNLLEKKQKRYNQIFVITESVFSMDGDIAPLKEFIILCKEFNANLIIDEAHATGVYGKNGAGLCNELNIENDCFARIYTFGKAMGTHGAVVVGNNLLKEYLINFSKPFIYTTALSLYDLLHIKYSFLFIQNFDYTLKQLINNIQYFKEKMKENCSIKIIGEGPIFALLIAGSENCRNKSKLIKEQGFDIKPIVYPTVAEGKERLRIIIHSFNTSKEIDKLSEILFSLPY